MKACSKIRRQRAEMNKAGDGDGQSPFARAEIQHAVLLQPFAPRGGVLVFEDALIDCEEINRGQNAAAQQTGCGDSLKIVFA